MEDKIGTLTAECDLSRDNLTEALTGAVGRFREILWLVLLCVFALGAILILIIDHSLAAWFLLIVCLLGALACAYVRFARPTVRARAVHRALSEVCRKENFSMYTVFAEKNVQCTLPTRGVLEIEYKKLRSAVRTERLIVLVTKSNLVLPIAADRIGGGTESDLLLFLMEHCKKLRLEGFGYTEE